MSDVLTILVNPHVKKRWKERFSHLNDNRRKMEEQIRYHVLSSVAEARQEPSGYKMYCENLKIHFYVRREGRRWVVKTVTSAGGRTPKRKK